MSFDKREVSIKKWSTSIFKLSWSFLANILMILFWQRSFYEAADRARSWFRAMKV